MKRFIMSGVVLLLLGMLLMSISPVVTFAAAAACNSNPPSGPVGTSFQIVCGGFTPNVWVYAYLVEPSGAAGPLFDHEGGLKVDEQGFVKFEIASREKNLSTLQTGTWTFVAEELAPGRTIKQRGQVSFTITGRAESVSGAMLDANPTLIHKPRQGYTHTQNPPFTESNLSFSEPVTLSGAGFAPHEMVTFWLEPANGGCASMTRHLAFVKGSASSALEQEINLPLYDGLGAQFFVDAKADANGVVSAQAYFTILACEGAWRFVARGNASGRGAQTWVTVIGNAVSTNAFLTADPPTVAAMFDTVHFRGWGFGVNEHLTCWLKTPQGQNLAYPDEFPSTYADGNKYLLNRAFKTDAQGEAAFSLTTGSVYSRIVTTTTNGGTAVKTIETLHAPLASEGALGEYAMTCRGDVSGSTAIARFLVTGGFVDP